MVGLGSKDGEDGEQDLGADGRPEIGGEASSMGLEGIEEAVEGSTELYKHSPDCVAASNSQDKGEAVNATHNLRTSRSSPVMMIS